MSLLDALLRAGGSGVTEHLEAGLGLDEDQVKAALQQLVPALGAGLQRNITGRGGLANLLAALTSGEHSRYIENPELLNREETVADGNRILGHLLGSKEASREVAEQASAESGIGADVLKQMLPRAATLVMGTLSRISAEEGILASGDAPAQPQKLLHMLTPLLGFGRNTSTEAKLDMIGRYLRNR